MRLGPKDVEFLRASFDLGHKFARGCPPTQTPTQKLKSVFSMFTSKEIEFGFGFGLAIQIQVSFAGFKNPKISGIHPSNIYEFRFGNDS